MRYSAARHLSDFDGSNSRAQCLEQQQSSVIECNVWNLTRPESFKIHRTYRGSLSDKVSSQTGEAACVVLYLEDDDATAYLFQLALQQAGTSLRLFRVTDGQEALAFLFRQAVYVDAPRPHVVILDINVPKKNGFEVLAAMKEDATLRDIPAVVFSSSSLRDDQARSLALGAHKYFQKSSDWRGFLSTAQEICAMVA